MPKTVLALAAPGFEPIELITPVDFLRRAGAEVLIAAVGCGKVVGGAHGITIQADVLFEEVKGQTYDMIFAPGGLPGTTNLAKNKDVVEFIKRHDAAKKFVTAICAAPGFVLAEACNILKGKHACGYPGCDKAIGTTGGYIQTDNVVVDGHIITSRGPGTALLIGFAMIKALFGEAKEAEIRKGVISPL